MLSDGKLGFSSSSTQTIFNDLEGDPAGDLVVPVRPNNSGKPILISLYLIGMICLVATGWGVWTYKFYYQRCLQLVNTIAQEMLVNAQDCAWQPNTNWADPESFLVPNMANLRSKEVEFRHRQEVHAQNSLYNQELRKMLLILYPDQQVVELAKPSTPDRQARLQEEIHELEQQNQQMETTLSLFLERFNQATERMQADLDQAESLGLNTGEYQPIYQEGMQQLSQGIYQVGQAEAAKTSLEKIVAGQQDLEIAMTSKKQELARQNGYPTDDRHLEELGGVILVRETGVQTNQNPDCNSVKCVALTFDDGPMPTTTPRLLEILKQRQVKATFFVAGSLAASNPSILENIHNQGHEIGNHSWSHADFTKLTDLAIAEEIHKTNQIIQQATGQTPRIFRPPYGAMNPRVISKINLPIVTWNVDTLDWRDRDPDIVAKRAVYHTEDKSIILMHDIHPSSVEATGAILDTLLKGEYHFVTVSELIGADSKAQVVYSQG